MRIQTVTVGAPTAVLTSYVQDDSDEMATAVVRPAVLVLPGGAYQYCSDREAEPVALAYLAEGFNAFVLRYAVGPTHPVAEAIVDGQAGLNYLRSHAEELRIDPHRIAAVGFSAGGHLAAALGTISPVKPDALILGYPVTLPVAQGPDNKMIPGLCEHVDANTPPTFVFSTCADTLVPPVNALAFSTALAQAQVAFETHVYLLGPHGLSLAKGFTANGEADQVQPAASAWLGDSVRFLHDLWGDFKVSGERATYQNLVARNSFGIDMGIGRLLADDRAVQILQSYVPSIAAQVEANPMTRTMSIRQVASLFPDQWPSSMLAELAEKLAALN